MELHLQGKCFYWSLPTVSSVETGLVSVSILVCPQSDFMKGVVVDVDGAIVKIGGVQIAVAINGGAGKAGVTGAVGSFDARASLGA